MVLLPLPRKKGDISVEEALVARRTVRSFQPTPLDLSTLSQVLWASNGLTQGGRRTVASAGALYPLEVYAVVGKGGVRELGAGVYRYCPKDHGLQEVQEGDVRYLLARASLGQLWMAEAPVTLAICAEYERTTCRYGDRGMRYVFMEVGHSAQNVFLQCEALGLGAGIIGAFYDEEVSTILSLPKEHRPLLLMPIGHPR